MLLNKIIIPIRDLNHLIRPFYTFLIIKGNFFIILNQKNFLKTPYRTIMKKYLLIAAMLVVSSIWGQSITFHVDDLAAGPANASWMFEFDDAPTYNIHDDNPFTISPDPLDLVYNNFAYRRFTWANASDGHGHGPSSSSCTEEQLNSLPSTNNVTLKLYGFTLKSFKHINTTNANANWAIAGQAGDKRIYTGGIGEIYVGVELKFRVTNCRLTVVTPYPTAQQCSNNYGLLNFQDDIGTGLAVTGAGMGTIDKDASDNNWEAELDPNNTGQIKYNLSTISNVIQGYYGYFDFDIQVLPTNFQEIIGAREIPLAEATTVSISESDVSFLFDTFTAKDDTLRGVYANQIKTAPGGTLPEGITNISNQFYWELGTTLKTYDVDVTFDISELTGITNANDLRILKRETSDANWMVWSDYTLVNSTSIRANNLTSFSEFAIGSVGSNNPLPVELTSFEANVINKDVTLTWETATELNNYGFEIERKKGNEDWIKIDFVPGSGNSNIIKNYVYVDKNLTFGKYLYRLKQIDNDGEFEYSNQVESEIINLSFNISQNYPNPFNPNTTISFSLPAKELVTLKIYDGLGKEITTLVNEELNTGTYEKVWDASLYGSGVYFYRFTAGGYSKTCKMLLVK